MLAAALAPATAYAQGRPDIVWMAGGHTDGAGLVFFSPDGQTLASGSWGTIKLWQVSDPGKPILIRTLTPRVTSVVFSPDGRMLVSGGGDGKIKLRRVWDGSLIRTLRGGHKG